MAASVSRGKPTSSPYSWGGTDSLCGLLAAWVWVREAEGGAVVWWARPVYSFAQRPPCDHILLIRRRAKPSAGDLKELFHAWFSKTTAKNVRDPDMLLGSRSVYKFVFLKAVAHFLYFGDCSHGLGAMCESHSLYFKIFWRNAVRTVGHLKNIQNEWVNSKILWEFHNPAHQIVGQSQTFFESCCLHAYPLF